MSMKFQGKQDGMEHTKPGDVADSPTAPPRAKNNKANGGRGPDLSFLHDHKSVDMGKRPMMHPKTKKLQGC
jgi:hypothetical protein